MTKDFGLKLCFWSVSKMTANTSFTKKSLMSPTSLNTERESRRRLGRARSSLLPILRLSIGVVFSENSLGELRGESQPLLSLERPSVLSIGINALFYRLSNVISVSQVLMPSSPGGGNLNP